MVTINPLFLIIFTCQFTGIFTAKITDNDELEGEDGFYNNETPEKWVDYLFIAFMVIHHVYYAYKFTDYSLSHIHSTIDDKEAKKMEKKEKKKMKKEIKKKYKRQRSRGYSKRKSHDPSNENTSELTTVFEKRKRQASKAKAKAEKAIKKAVVSKNFTTKSTSTSQKRSMNNIVCCCIHCAPRFFTWQRTAIIRLFFRIYASISCLLAMVLVMEFFMNLFVEFFITCVVHYSSGYIASLLLLPLMTYVIETLIRLSWHAVYVSWQINCDANGDFESVESDGSHHFNLQGDRFLFSYKMDSGDIEDEYNQGFISSTDQDSSETSSSESSIYDESDSESNDNNSIASFKNIASRSSTKKNTLSPRSQDLGIIVEEDIDVNKKKKKNNKRSESDMDKIKYSISLNDEKNDNKKGKKKQRSMTEDNPAGRREKGYKSVQQDEMNRFEERKIEQLKEERQKEKEIRRQEREEHRKEREEMKLKWEKQKQEAKERRRKMKKEQREQMGDYFIATCWRAWFCIGTIATACIGSYTINIELAINGFFWQLVMRYSIIGGLLWGVIYLFFASILCFMSRMMSWKLLHPNISRWKFFCLIDAKDHEKKNKAWRNCKVFTMISCLIFFVIFMILGLFLGFKGNSAAGFLVFIAMIWISYYFNNLFMSCKPMGLIALWTDTIPPPGKNFFAHLQVSENLQDSGYLNRTLKLSNVDTQVVKIGTNLELARLNSDQDDNTKKKNVNVNVNKKRKHKMSTDEIDNLSLATGVSAYIPNAETLHVTQSHQEFAEERVTALLQRYKKFKYVYKEPTKDSGKKMKRCGFKYWYLKIRLFWNNYKNYWLNVYRPFDEYDMETTIDKTNILHGFQWFKPCVECRCFKKKTKKGKCGKCCAYLMDNTCNICLIIFFAGLIGILFFFASQFGINTNVKSELFSLSQSNENNNNNNKTRNVIQYYPICSEYFGADININKSFETDLSVLDMLFLSQVVYEMDNFNINEILDKYFDSQYEIIGSQYIVPFYFHMKHKQIDVDYVSIRGTAGLQEALQDISLFVEIGLFEGLQWLVPFLNALPTSFVTAMIYYASLTEQLINADVRAGFDEPIYDYLSTYLENTTTSHLHIVGHSLGGGIASIVAANLFEDDYDSFITSFGVCSPGVLYSSAKFGFGIEALDKTSRSLLPRRDLVSMVDSHGGSVQYTNCKETSMLNCHVMPSVICEVYQNCPNTLAKKPHIFDCYCSNDDIRGQQFGYCLNATIL